MTQPKTDLVYLRSEKAKAEQQLRSCQHREKILERQMSELNRREVLIITGPFPLVVLDVAPDILRKLFALPALYHFKDGVHRRTHHDDRHRRRAHHLARSRFSCFSSSKRSHSQRYRRTRSSSRFTFCSSFVV